MNEFLLFYFKKGLTLWKCVVYSWSRLQIDAKYFHSDYMEQGGDMQHCRCCIYMDPGGIFFQSFQKKMAAQTDCM